MHNKQAVRSILLCLILWTIGKSANAQTSAQQPLSSLLPKLEQQYQLKFNYAEDVIMDIAIVPPKPDLEVTELLTILEDRTKLNFDLTANNMVLITAKAQTAICGHVKDAQTQEPLSNVVVTLGADKVITDAQGYFEIQNPKPNGKLHLRHLGYKIKLVDVGEFATDCKDILLYHRV